MSEGQAQYRVIQNGNPFEDARKLSRDRGIEQVIDVGANVGDVAAHLLANFPSAIIHAFEPHQQSFNVLQQRFSENRCVTPVNFGLSDNHTKQELNLYGTSGLNSLLPISECSPPFLEGYDPTEKGTEVINVTKLDYYCRAQSIHIIDFLKLDIQGWELKCLDGARDLLSKNRIRFIYAEVNFVELYKGQIFYEDVARYLRDFGFRLFSLYALSFNRAGQLCWADALFYRPQDVSR
jgi:FkbM family methyltransferase